MSFNVSINFVKIVSWNSQQYSGSVADFQVLS